MNIIKLMVHKGFTDAYARKIARILPSLFQQHMTDTWQNITTNFLSILICDCTYRHEEVKVGENSALLFISICYEMLKRKPVIQQVKTHIKKLL